MTNETRTIRRRRACWTCHLRKKKCDEKRPSCDTCFALKITCHGYGVKPDWMDGGDAEREVGEQIKETVKYTSRRKRSVRGDGQRLPGTVALAPKDSHAISPSHPTQGDTLGEGPLTLARQESSSNGLDPDVHEQQSVRQSPVTSTTIAPTIDESPLLMHFLDLIFALQYPMYKPDTMQGGRGWLLSLLLTTRPLYHAVLALAAYHRWLLIFTKSGPECRVVATLKQERHLESCLGEVQSTITAVNRLVNDGRADLSIGIVASVCQLVFLDLFTSSENKWRIHLGGAIEIYRLACADDLAHLPLTKRSRQMILEHIPITLDGAQVAQEVITIRFITGTLLWLDVIASVTSGSTPAMQAFHSEQLGPNSMIKLEEIMGCNNWVMILISRVSALYAEKEVASHTQHQPDTTTEERLNAIQAELEYKLSSQSLHTSRCVTSSTDTQEDDSFQINLVTTLFAHAAYIYAHLVIHGFNRFDLIHKSYSSAMSILLHANITQLVPAIIFPLHMIGGVAVTDRDKYYFRNLTTSAPFLNPLYKNRERLASILEDIWSRTSSSEITFSWAGALELQGSVLLI